MDQLKTYLYNNFEQILVFTILIAILFINYFADQKMAFLNFYFLPILFAGYLLGRRTAVLASLFCILLTVIFFITVPRFFQTSDDTLTVSLSLILWGSFLILTSYITGTLFEQKEKSVQDLRNAYLGVLEILSKYLESTDRYTQGHCVRVANLVTEIAIAMELPRVEIENIKAAALLHDIGKVDVSMDILKKASRLNEEEKKEMDAHTEKGAKILKSMGNVLKEAVPMVLAHHKQYKDLAGDSSISHDAKIGSYIIAVADTYDAIITDRPYRAGKSPSKALEEIERESGGQFHPEVVKAFKKIFGTRISEIENNIIPFKI